VCLPSAGVGPLWSGVTAALERGPATGTVVCMFSPLPASSSHVRLCLVAVLVLRSSDVFFNLLSTNIVSVSALRSDMAT